LLIHAGASLAYSDAEGNTALHFAALNGSIEVTKLLLQNDSDIRAKNLQGHTPLDLASSLAGRAVALLLVEHGGNTEAESPRQGSATSFSPESQKGLNRSLSPFPTSQNINVTPLDRKYCAEHFTCCVCPKVFDANDSYYEHETQVYCLEHYTTMFAQRCSGCKRPILRQSVEISRNGENQYWHQECQAVHKYLNVCLTKDGDNVTTPDLEDMEVVVREIWTTLSVYEETTASYISDYVLHAGNGSIVESLAAIMGLIDAIAVLFSAVETLDEATIKAGKQGSYFIPGLNTAKLTGSRSTI
jgi:hypothetical protein